jgi:hypothetical protein
MSAIGPAAQREDFQNPPSILRPFCFGFGVLKSAKIEMNVYQFVIKSLQNITN